MSEQQAPSENGKATAEEMRMYVEQLRGAIMFRNLGGRVKRWKVYARIMANNYTGGNEVDQPVVNIMGARSRGIAPQVAFNEPTFEVKCVGALPNPNSEAANAVMLEKCWRDEEITAITQRVLMDWPGIGRGIWFTGFEAANEGDVLDSKRAIADARTNLVDKPDTAGVISKVRKMFGMQTDKPVDPPGEQRSFSMVLDMRVFANRVSPFNFVLDPCAESVQDATFMARRLFLPLERAKLMFGSDCPEADSVSNVAIYTNESETDPFGTPDVTNATAFPESVKRVEAWELWNIVTRKTVYISRTGQPIGQPFPWKSAHPGFPFVIVDWDEVEDCVYPEGVCSALHPLNNELNAIRKRELAEMGKAFNVYRASKNLSAEAEKELREATDDAIVKMEDDETLDAIVRQPMPSDIWTVENRVLANMDEVSRTNSQMSGGMNAVRRTATEVSASASGTDAAMSLRQLQVETAVGQIAERMLASIFATFDQPVTLQIANQDHDFIDSLTGAHVPIGAMIDYDFVGVDHAAFYKVTVSSGSMASVARDVERQQAGEVWQLYSDELWFDRQAFAIHHMGMFPSIKNPGQFVLKSPPVDPNQPPVPGQEAGQTQTGGATLTPNGGGEVNMQADLLAATYGGGAPMTGVNGYPGTIQ